MNASSIGSLLPQSFYFRAAVRLRLPRFGAGFAGSRDQLKVANKAQNLIAEGRVDAAMSLMQTIPIKAEDQGVRATIGLMALARLGELSQAERHARAIARTYPSIGVYRGNIGCILALLRRDLESMAEFRAAVALDPNYDVGWSALAIGNALLQDWDAASVAAERALDLGDEVESKLVLLTSICSNLRRGLPDTRFVLPNLNDISDVQRNLSGFSPLPPVMVANPNGHHISLAHPVYTDEATAKNDATVFIYCDGRYLRLYGISAIYSLRAVQEIGRIHIHVVDHEHDLTDAMSTLAQRVNPLTVTWTSEKSIIPPGVSSRVFHSCFRFLRLWHFLEFSRSPVLFLDADVLFRQPIGRTLERVSPDTEFAANIDFERPPWGQCYANAMFLSGSVFSRDLLAKVSLVIMRNLRSQTALWFMDQIALAEVVWRYLGDHRIQSIKHFFSRFDSLDARLWTDTTTKGADTDFSRTQKDLFRQYGHPDEILR